MKYEDILTEMQRGKQFPRKARNTRVESKRFFDHCFHVLHRVQVFHRRVSLRVAKNVE